jgi:ERCC4-type nuclease|tara:strand:- start:1869 stop:2372 length:504 start_codon:yes stop_codon:yes gene_type:complete
MAKYKTAPGYTVVRDTREQQGYFFKKFNTCQGTVQRKLDTGDYSILGMEDKVCIERKASVSEIALNLGKGKYAFYNEVERMRDYEHKFIVCEFSMEDVMRFPEGAKIPKELKGKVKITGKYILRCLMEFAVFNDVHVVFAGSERGAFDLISSLLKRINEKYTIGRKS